MRVRLDWARAELQYKECFDEAYFLDDEESRVRIAEYRSCIRILKEEVREETGKLKRAYIRKEIKVLQALCGHVQNCQNLKVHSPDTLEIMKPEIYVSLHVKNLANATVDRTYSCLDLRAETVSVLRDISCRYLGSKEARKFISLKISELNQSIQYCLNVGTTTDIRLMSQAWLKQNMVE